MSELNEYVVQGPAGDYTVQLTDDEAEARGLKRAAAARKSAKPQNKSAAPSKKTPAKKTTAQKRAEVAEKSFGGRTSSRTSRTARGRK